ncbi:translaldolase [Lapidilactobacillus dextrinicus DSM 20335]|uniref:Translaldolase n=1 Tax=Lapidilactobacillus dextrinicus DSM 20335 TaxID=1423738 RepID=A0A0R2BIB7_9LACO|nr:transaldolase [Lapidilactobacillus dextrinicus]KRM78549.1 translaldolase [Lapidilactobacillus dextrinicus DSM 20335]QFG46129.1 transaldolase [Lapidilactobacillus dextrinicus]
MTEFKIAIYADGASVDGMVEAREKWPVSGFTTNPSLMKKAGVTDYVQFAKEALTAVQGMPLSFEVFSDDFEKMEKEAERISSLGSNVFVKIPITNTKGESSVPLIKKLSSRGIQVNVTAILTLNQVKDVVKVLSPDTKNIISVFAGRIADTGVDPMPLMKEAVTITSNYPQADLLWASCREVFNIFQAQELGVDIITVTNAVLNKLSMVGKDLNQLSLETVQGFYKDVKALGFSII